MLKLNIILTRRIIYRQAAYPLWLLLVGGVVSGACITALLILLCHHADRDSNHTIPIAIMPLLLISGVCWWCVFSFREKLEVESKKEPGILLEDGKIQEVIISQPILHAEFQPIEEPGPALPNPPIAPPTPERARADSTASTKTNESVRSRLESNFGGLARTMTTRENRAGGKDW
jgi:hypothetical protein